MEIKDYRNTSYKECDFSINNKKTDFLTFFSSIHPKAWNVYDHVSVKQNDLNYKFREMYYDKCIYCGVSIQVIDSSNFEVDHFIPKEILKKNLPNYDSRYINGINNLVNSCKSCNRAKSNFICEETSLNLIHPDSNKLHEIYVREKDYSIKIHPKYSANEMVSKFYRVLKLDSQLKRLDYLIMEMKDFCERYNDRAEIMKLHQLLLSIEDKRRRVS